MGTSMATEPCLHRTEAAATRCADAPLLFSTQRRPRVLLPFFRHNFMSTIACFAGMALTMFVFVTTWWLSKQTYDCPDWAIDCTVTKSVLLMKAHSGILQGALTTAYGIGLAALLYPVYTLAEAAVWPILHQQTCTLAQLDTYLKATRGSLISQPIALLVARSWNAAAVLSCVFVSAAFYPFGATIVGYTWSLQNVTVTNIASKITVGAGLGLEFNQAFPGPPPLPGAVAGAFYLMSSWGNNYSTEPLPEYRDYIVDRRSLARIGNMSALAVKIHKTIDCTPRSLELSEGHRGMITAATNFPNPNSSVHLRTQPFLTKWVDEVKVLNHNRSVSTVVFAAVNGKIEGGEKTDSTNIKSMKAYTNGVSAIACNIDVELRDSVITIGESTTERGNLSTVSSLRGPGHKKDRHVEALATWLGSATTVFGINVNGAQPVYGKGANGMAIWTSSAINSTGDNWTLAEIEDFINVSTGAVAMRLPGFVQSADPATIFSQYSSLQLDHSRSYILILPVATILAMTLVLAWRNAAMHSRMRIPAMRLATVSDILKSSQTTDIRLAAGVDALDPTMPSKLGAMEVRYGLCPGDVVGLGKPAAVSLFDGKCI